MPQIGPTKRRFHTLRSFSDKNWRDFKIHWTEALPLSEGSRVQKQGNSHYHWVDVGDKTPTRRVCLASGKLSASPTTLKAIQTGTLPKGNPLPLAEAAGLLAVKNTPTQLPLCHPLPIDSASIRFEFEPEGLRVFCEVRAHAKTGVEMEALSGASAALLCIYDLTKGIDPALWISDLHLIEKTGGKSGNWRHPKATTPETPPATDGPDLEGALFTVITLSDRAARGEYEDLSGPALCEKLSRSGGTLDEAILLPDDPDLLEGRIRSILESKKTSLLVTTGGTGMAPRDRTPEALESLSRKMNGRLLTGFGERIRSRGEIHTPLSALTRAEAYAIGETLVLALPGSVKGALEGLDAVLELIPHSLKLLKGRNDRHARPC